MLLALVLSAAISGSAGDLRASPLTPDGYGSPGLRIPDDLQLIRDKGNQASLIVYSTWSVATVATGAIGLATTHDPKWQGAHIAHLTWGGVNLVIALISDIITFKSAPEKEDPEKALSGAHGQNILYAINAMFDVATIGVSALILKEVHDDRWQGFAIASLVQAAWLLAYDTTMALYHQLNAARAER